MTYLLFGDGRKGVASPRGLDVMYQYPKKTLHVPLTA